MAFWGPWYQDDAGVVVDGRIDFVVEVMVDGGWEYGIVVAVGGWHWECGIMVAVEG
jgi:hypothetical protein